jgi:hypothetical protein
VRVWLGWCREIMFGKTNAQPSSMKPMPLRFLDDAIRSRNFSDQVRSNYRGCLQEGIP